MICQDFEARLQAFVDSPCPATARLVLLRAPQPCTARTIPVA